MLNRSLILAAAASLLVAGAARAQASEKPDTIERNLRLQAAEAAKTLAIQQAQDSGEASAPEQEAVADQDDSSDFRVYWDDGLRMETADGNFQFRIGGRIQYDWTFWGDSKNVEDVVLGPIENGSEFRRARVFVQGYIYKNVEWKSQFDFADGEVALKDVYIGTRNQRVNFRFGHLKEPFGLETLMSSKYITFIERGLPTIFDSERNAGFLIFQDNSRHTWGFGVFRETEESGTSFRDNYALTARVTGTPIHEDGGRKIVHLGVAASWRHIDEKDTLLFGQEPEVHQSPRFISSGVIPADSLSAVGLEAALIYGSFSAQGEYRYAVSSSEETGDPDFSGWYVYGSYWLTGESRNYRSGVFNRVRPNRNFLDDNGGLGAWEVGLRFSNLDLGNEGIKTILGSRLDNITVGVNWHWNPMTRLMWNVIRSDLDEAGDIWAFTWRGQIEF